MSGPGQEPPDPEKSREQGKPQEPVPEDPVAADVITGEPDGEERRTVAEAVVSIRRLADT
ncbi:hypothetical protein OG909_21465 [Streptomyces sp. NBC_01754]|uniref:hypothetical protein n=1 Tax=Streptomyces sp. NBC_01754 TaxID=2975930 RepID=UPI002DD99304|nr:hypothetical protein [Streptomyces sp. NBC_01754]WSC94635.1 hypothetical protein OG909_21465 [Streptomyces sp. NBC_01754]